MDQLTSGTTTDREEEVFELRWLADDAVAQYRYAVDSLRNLTQVMAQRLDGIIQVDQLLAMLESSTLDAPTCPNCTSASTQQMPVAEIIEGTTRRTDFRCARCAFEHPMWWT